MGHYIQGLTMGLAYLAPIGMQNLFVINSALRHRRSRALATALIVIFFDITLALACFFGAGAVMQRWKWLQMAILLLGSCLVVLIGIGLVRSREIQLEDTGASLSLWGTVSAACVVTWFNPQAVIDGTLMLGAFRASLPGPESLRFIAGVVSASCLWFTGLTLVVSIFREKINTRVLRWINVVCGVVIVGYGIKLFFHFLSMLS